MFYNRTTDCYVAEHKKLFGGIGKSPYLCTTLKK